GRHRARSWKIPDRRQARGARRSRPAGVVRDWHHAVKTLMLVCGEPSGDQLGAQLMAAIKQLAGDRVRIVGVGGPAMTREGLTSLYSLDATAVMGLREVVPAIPRILARVKQAADYAVSIHPDALVVIDSPDFTHRIAR